MSETSVLTPEHVTRHVYVKVRHSADCPDRAKEEPLKDSKTGQTKKDPETGRTLYPDFGDCQKCRCRKWIFFYDSGVGTETRRESAKTRVWGEAQAKAQEWLDQFDPTKIENKRLKAEQVAKNGTSKRIEEAIASWAVKKFTNGDRTKEHVQTQLGIINPKTFEVEHCGKFLKWVDTLSPRPIFVSDITIEQLSGYVDTWAAGYAGNTITAMRSKLSGFFRYCHKMKWTTLDIGDIEFPPTDGENSIAHFEDEQYDKILVTAQARAEAATNKKGNTLSLARRHERQRTLTIIQLMRHSGMSLVDATLFKQEWIDEKGVLMYWRQKTGKRRRAKGQHPAIVVLPADVIELIRNVPVADGTPSQPFRSTKITDSGKQVELDSNEGYWRRHFEDVWTEAGVTEIQTDAGPKQPHPHMLRHTFAIYWIQQPGIHVEDVAVMLGDTEQITRKTYLKWCSTLADTHVAKMQQAMRAKPEPKDNVVEIGGRR